MRWGVGRVLFMALACGGCTKHVVTVEYSAVGGYDFSASERRAIQTVADAAALEVRRLLPALPEELVLVVGAGDRVIEETGETGTALPPRTVYWTVDPAREGGVASTVKTQLRATLFHELHHLVRRKTIRAESLFDDAVTEGMATVFERDHAGAAAPWGRYPSEVAEWAEELRALPSNAPREEWMSRHPDGRRWIAYKVGAYLVDRAVRGSGKSAAELVAATTEDVLAMGR